MYRNIIHIHIPAFPITVLRVSRSELRDRPVAITTSHSKRSLLLSVSPEARREGISKGMSLDEAIKLCPRLIVLPPNRDLTEKAFHALIKLGTQYTPLYEPARPGHIYLDVTGTERLWGKAKDTASRLSREIKEILCFSGTAGVAGNKMVSSIAAGIASSEEVRDVNHGRESSFIAPMKAGILPGISHVSKKILLEELNITLVRELAALDMETLRIVFGSQAYIIHQRSLGIDPTPVYPPSMEPIVSEELALSRDENDDQRLLGVLYKLVEKCSHRLLSKTLFPSRAGMLFRYADQKEIIRLIDLPRMSFQDFDLYTPLERIFLMACQRRVRVRFMKVWFGNFSPPFSQLSIFSTEIPIMKKKNLVTQAMNHIRERYGETKIQYGKTKIALSSST